MAIHPFVETKKVNLMVVLEEWITKFRRIDPLGTINVIVIHVTVVEIIQSGPMWWTDRPNIPRATAATARNP